MLHRLRLSLYVPLYRLLGRSSVREAAFRDALRLFAPQRPTREDVLEGLALPQVRAVIYHRLSLGATWERLAGRLFARLQPGIPGFELNCREVGAGLLIVHGYGSVLWAQRIGEDCEIRHGVTLGTRRQQLPVIGDHVKIYQGAMVLGGVTIGDHAIVGPGAIVLADVDAGAVVVGNPARAIQSRWSRTASEHSPAST